MTQAEIDKFNLLKSLCDLGELIKINSCEGCKHNNSTCLYYLDENNTIAYKGFNYCTKRE
jgi:hypothetical protein